MAELDIGEVARRSGLPPSALRFYEEQGLIRPIGRKGLRRVYGSEVIDRLALIALGRAAGFSLEEAGKMLAAGGRPRIDRSRLAAKAGELDQTIRRLIAVRKGLRHAAACPAPSHMECPTFRRLMQQALKPPAAPPRSPRTRAPSASGAGAPDRPRRSTARARDSR